MKRTVFVLLVLGCVAGGLADCAKKRSSLVPSSAKTNALKTPETTTFVVSPEDLKNVKKWVPANGKTLLKDLDAAAFDFPMGLSFPANKVSNSMIKFSDGEIFTKDESKIDATKQTVCTIHFKSETGSVSADVKSDEGVRDLGDLEQDPNYTANYKGMTMIAVQKTVSKDRVLFATSTGETTAFSASVTTTVDGFNTGCFKGKVRILVPQGSKQSASASAGQSVKTDHTVKTGQKNS